MKKSFFVLIMFCTVAMLATTSCKKSCDTCTAKLKFSGALSGEIDIPLETKEECEEAKSNIGETVTEDGVTGKLQSVNCK